MTHVHTEAQLRNEMEILNTITEDLRLKDWEHSMALKNLTILEGQQRQIFLSNLGKNELKSRTDEKNYRPQKKLSKAQKSS